LLVAAAPSAFTSTRDALVYLVKKTPKKGPKMPLLEAECHPSLTAAVVLNAQRLKKIQLQE
jgi:hypothetical protein